MKEVIKIIILTISSFLGAIFSVFICDDLIIIDEEKISIWFLLLIGLIGAVVSWLITDFLIKRIIRKKY